MEWEKGREVGTKKNSAKEVDGGKRGSERKKNGRMH